MQAEHKDLQQTIDQLNEKMKARAEEQETEKEDLQRKIEQVGRASDKWQSQLKQVQKSLAKAEERLKHKDVLLQQKDALLKEKNGNVLELRRQLEGNLAIQGKVNSLKKEAAKLDRVIEDRMEFSESVMTALGQLRTATGKRRQEAEDLEKTCIEFQVRNTELQKENTQLEETRCELHRLQRECKAKKVETKCELRRLERECKAKSHSLALLKQGEHLKAFLCIIQPELLCPIEYELFTDPVVAADGHTYDRHAIKKWHALSPGSKSPMTGMPFDNRAVVPNFAVRKLIQLFKEWQQHVSMVSDEN
jgi:chromosome segregation ATPase